MRYLILALKFLVKLAWWGLFAAPLAVFFKVVSFFLGFLIIAPWVWLGKNGNYPYPIRYVAQPDDSLAIGDRPTVEVDGVQVPTANIFQDREGTFTKAYPEWVRNYILAVMWSCWRNPAYGWDALMGVRSDVSIVLNKGLGISFKNGWKNIFSLNPDIDWGYNAQELAIYTTGIQFILAETGYWNLRLAFSFPFTTFGLLIQLGWNLRGLVVNSKIRNLKIDIAGKNTVKNKFNNNLK
jgi:hypothetical protein